jgi:hypothetical protein
LQEVERMGGVDPAEGDVVAEGVHLAALHLLSWY